ncbi:MAG: glycosyltransferase, partial [Nitrosopumilaceae archaeon]
TTTPGLGRYVISMGAKKENVETFHLGINLKVFRPLQKDIALLRQLGLEENSKIIVFMGTLYDFSGLDNIISNFNILKNAIGNIRLLIVGGGPDLVNLRTLVKRKKLENEIKITGFIPQEDIPKYIALADICVNPFYINIVTDSILPTKILEYSACGKPVISTPLKGTVELLPNENFGVTYSTTENFIENMINLLLDEKKMKELGENGHLYVKMNHDWDKLSEKLLQKFKDFTS